MMGESEKKKIVSGANSSSFVVTPVRNHLAGEEKNGRGRRPDTGFTACCKAIFLTFRIICPVSFASHLSSRVRENVSLCWFGCQQELHQFHTSKSVCRTTAQCVERKLCKAFCQRDKLPQAKSREVMWAVAKHWKRNCVADLRGPLALIILYSSLLKTQCCLSTSVAHCNL